MIFNTWYLVHNEYFAGLLILAGVVIRSMSAYRLKNLDRTICSDVGIARSLMDLA